MHSSVHAINFFLKIRTIDPLMGSKFETEPFFVCFLALKFGKNANISLNFCLKMYKKCTKNY